MNLIFYANSNFLMVCSQCGKRCGVNVYINKLTGEKWWPYCISIEKKKRLKSYLKEKYKKNKN